MAGAQNKADDTDHRCEIFPPFSSSMNCTRVSARARRVRVLESPCPPACRPLATAPPRYVLCAKEQNQKVNPAGCPGPSCRRPPPSVKAWIVRDSLRARLSAWAILQCAVRGSGARDKKRKQSTPVRAKKTPIRDAGEPARAPCNPPMSMLTRGAGPPPNGNGRFFRIGPTSPNRHANIEIGEGVGPSTLSRAVDGRFFRSHRTRSLGCLVGP